MSNNVLAIANCRVSSAEQLQNNSLSRQKSSVYAAAVKLNATIVQVWSGSVSSKAGTNVRRKDLLEMLEVCKKNKKIKYAIFDEYDRYMRSVNEGPYFEVLFQQLGVKVWYASDSDTFNGYDAMAKFMRSMSAFKAEGSSEERQWKSIKGQTTALKEGRFPFSPKPGYKRGTRAGLQEIHPIRGPALKEVLIRIAEHRITPTKGLIELNRSEYSMERAPLKMDKFRKIATDSFNAGIVEIHKQVDVKNPLGKHKSLITLEQHREIVRIFEGKKKNQLGPRKNGNPEYIMNAITAHDTCLNLKNKGKFVGFQHSNGRNTHLTYKKYRCRTCGFYMTRDDLHSKAADLFTNNPITDKGLKNFLDALDIVWNRKDMQSRQDIARISRKIDDRQENISNRALAAIDPANISIKQEILKIIESAKQEVSELEAELASLSQEADTDRRQFMEFAYSFVGNMGERFLSLTPEEAKKCKQIMFPAGFYVDANRNVYTTEISPLIRLASKKKDLPEPEKSLLVRVQGL